MLTFRFIFTIYYIISVEIAEKNQLPTNSLLDRNLKLRVNLTIILRIDILWQRVQHESQLFKFLLKIIKLLFHKTAIKKIALLVAMER